MAGKKEFQKIAGDLAKRNKGKKRSSVAAESETLSNLATKIAEEAFQFNGHSPTASYLSDLSSRKLTKLKEEAAKSSLVKPA